MIKYKDLKQYWIQPDQSFFPNPKKSQSVPWEGETQSLNRTSPHPKTPNRSREEDSISVLTIPLNLFKKKLERLNEELVKKPRLPFHYWYNWKIENSLDIAKLEHTRKQILINPWISQYTRMKSTKILQKSEDFMKYIEDLCNIQKSRSEKQIKVTEFWIECTM